MMCILQVHVKSLQEQAAGAFPALQDAEQGSWGGDVGSTGRVCRCVSPEKHQFCVLTTVIF